MGSRPSSPAKKATAPAEVKDAFSLREREDGKRGRTSSVTERSSVLLPSQIEIQREELERQNLMVQLANYRFSHDMSKPANASPILAGQVRSATSNVAARADDNSSSVAAPVLSLPQMVRPPGHAASTTPTNGIAVAGFNRSTSQHQASVTENLGGTPRSSVAGQPTAAISCDRCSAYPSVLPHTPRRPSDDHYSSGGAVAADGEKVGQPQHTRRPQMTPLSPSLSMHQPSSGNATPQSTPRTRHRGRTPSSVRYGSSLVEVEFVQLSRSTAPPPCVSPQQRVSTPRSAQFFATDSTVFE